MEENEEQKTVLETENHGIAVNIDDPEKTRYEMKKSGELEQGLVLGSPKKPNVLTADNLGNLKYIIQDVINGDTEALKRPEIKSLGFDKVKKAIEWLAKADNLSPELKSQLVTQGWRLNFRDKPPTPEEYLTPKYIGDMANTLHPWIRNTFIEFFNPLAPYRNLILSSCIGTGKSQPLDSKVYTSKGSYKRIGDLEVGDKVLSPDGSITEVVATKDWEPEDIYELEMDNGKTMRCGLHHLHHVSFRTDESGNKIWDDVETKFILDHPENDYEFYEVKVDV